MAPFALLSGRRLAQVSELASPLVGSIFAVSSPTPVYMNERVSGSAAASSPAIFARSTQVPANQIPQYPSATVGLVGFICFLVAGVLIIIGWKLFQLRQMRRDSRRKSLLPSVDPMSEKRLRPLILAPSIPLSPSVRWVPAKLSPWVDPRLPQKPVPSLSKDSILSRPESSWSYHHATKKASLSELSSDQSMYPSSADSTVSITRQMSSTQVVFLSAVEKVMTAQVTVSDSKAGTEESSDLKQIDLSLKPPGLETQFSSNDPVVSEESSDSGPVDNASSPTESSDSDLGTSECSSVVDSCAHPGFPKLVIVKRTFPVSLPDELKVKQGERLRLLREFKDGWTLCQRSSKRNPEKGAVPRCCLTELSIDTVSAQNSHREGAKKEVQEAG